MKTKISTFYAVLPTGVALVGDFLTVNNWYSFQENIDPFQCRIPNSTTTMGNSGISSYQNIFYLCLFSSGHTFLYRFDFLRRHNEITNGQIIPAASNSGRTFLKLSWTPVLFPNILLLNPCHFFRSFVPNK